MRNETAAILNEPVNILVTLNPYSGLASKPAEEKTNLLRSIGRVPIPSEDKVKYLNALASKPPFCVTSKTRRFDTL